MQEVIGGRAPGLRDQLIAIQHITRQASATIVILIDYITIRGAVIPQEICDPGAKRLLDVLASRIIGIGSQMCAVGDTAMCFSGGKICSS